MPLLKGGRYAVTRTKKYLDAGRIIFRENVKIMAINTLSKGEISEGAREFIKWHLPPLQYKNPSVQIVTLRDICPTPFIKFYLSDGREFNVDCSFHTADSIQDHIALVCAKTYDTIKREEVENQKIVNPANFGSKYPRQCICEVYGQVPCSSQQGKSKPWEGQEPNLPPMPEEVEKPT
ncbi:28S ribosomal protein S25 mitochondrial [Echinococcus multilocularis]|uniref:Small ribosomal subunit protein mS25 n=1 Tax=Echinococcus multilocularis TaxID=6211 RepID=A0A068Y149_ECHMU|nr:28S ribosomal protein S25 mitochondrial [Echinococcus multilocularis]